MLLKILVHVFCLVSFLFGLVVVHVLLNNSSVLILFFGYGTSRTFWIDFCILLIGTSFFVEFFMMFRPIQVIEKKKGGVDV